MPEPVSSPGRRTTCKGDLPLVLNGRKSLITVIASSRARLHRGSIPGGSAQASPSIDDVQHRVDRLYHAAEQASERYNQIHVQLKQMRGDVKALRADQARQQNRTEQARRIVADSIVRQYEGDSLSAVGQAVVSSDPSAFVSQLTTMSAFNSMQAGQYSSYLTQAKALSIRQDATGNQLAKVARLEKEAAAEQGDHRAQPGRGQERARQAEGRRARPRLIEASRGDTAASRPRTSRSPAAPPPPCTSRWPRSASPTSTAPPARAPTTAPA